MPRTAVPPPGEQVHYGTIPNAPFTKDRQTR